MKPLNANKHTELANECDFWSVPKKYLQACCYYEYFRESKVMRDTCVLPTCHDQIARLTLAFVLNKHGWPEAAKKDKAPPSWNSLNANAREQIARWIKECVASKSKNWERHPPLLVQEFWPGAHPSELKHQLEKWKEYAYYGAPPADNFPFSSVNPKLLLKSWKGKISRRRRAARPAFQEGQRSFPVETGREYLFGFIRLDKSYDETDAGEAFKRRFAGQFSKRMHGNPQFLGKLLQLAAMRVRHHYKRRKRQRILAELTGKAAYKGEQHVADSQLSRDCKDAKEFFQTLFPGQRPISATPKS